MAPKSKSEFLIPPQARRILAGHQVERLRHHGHTIVPSDGIVRTYRAASTLGQKYMLPTTFGCDREEAERWFELHQSALAGLPGVDTVQLEYRDELDSDWEPLAAAASPTAPAQEES
ncbi:hypothetical protein [Rhodococcus sp. B10]|uniref:hypothetical protein n=1 Tax=Rhodococcus sp. B10 TaxID=2695876 RepID=UPI001430F57F|nr:hypothetical protein [Rhodococcus sp. B10]